MSKPEPVSMFISYAHKDESLCDQLKAHLSLLQHQGLVSTWHDRRILPGADWAQEIDMYLETAPIVLLLVSASFFTSNYCIGVEMKRAMSRHEAGQARVIPILVRPCDWKSAPFVHLQILPKNARAITAWNNRDKAWADVIAGIRRVIEELPPLSVSTSPAALPPIWNVPYPHNPLFTGREELLTQLATSLHAGQPTALSQSQAISGLGGIGKTQLALEYAYRSRGDYQATLWVQADTRENLTSSYLTIATLLNLPEKSEQESARVIAAVKNWLQHNTRWLLILDNADDLALARDFLPPSPGGQVLLTTRAQATGRFARRLEVDVLPTELGTLFLLRRAGLLAPDAILEQASESDRDQARSICEELGGLPLALDQAGAYIEETRCSLSDYQQRYQTRRARLLKRRGELVADHPDAVATTWSLSFEKVKQANPAAADLLRLCAFLAPDAIPEEIITLGAAHLGPLLEPTASDPTDLDEAIGALGAYSLIRRNATEKTLSIHRLVQAVLKDQMDEKTQQQWAERTVSTIDATRLAVEHGTWPQWERLLAHALACSELIEHQRVHAAEATELLQQTGWYLTERARYQEAELLLKQALSITEQEHGLEHLDTARDSSTLAYLYQAQGKYEQAEPLFQRALAIYEQQLGPDHPAMATSLNNLALLYWTQGKYEQAEPLYLRALAIREQQLGPLHPNTAQSLNNLASLYSNQGKYEQAEPLYLRALSIREQQLGLHHPDTASSLNNLALLYKTQGKYEQAEPLYLRALSIREQQMGLHHPDTASSLNNLALLYKTQGKYEQAEPLFQRALSIYEQQLGPEHPSTATNLNNLASLYQDQGKDEQAEPLYQRALSIKEQQLGPLHPNTATSLNNLAGLYQNQGKYAQAEPLYLRALSIREQLLGPQHPDTAQSLNNLAALYRDQGKYEQAEPLYLRALSIVEQLLGPLHPNTASSLNNLAALYYNQSKYAQAEPLLKHALAIREQQLGPQHPDTANSLNDLAELYWHQGKTEQAEPLYQQALAIREQQLGPEHPDTAQSLDNLALLYQAQGKDEQAEPLLKRALAIDEGALGSQHPTTQRIRTNYADLLRTMGHDAEAAALDQP